MQLVTAWFRRNFQALETFKRVGLKMSFKIKELSWYAELKFKEGMQIPGQLGNG